MANSIHAQAEQWEIVAVFDTKELAEAYVSASVLPGGRRIGRMYHSYRPDSLLWEYNAGPPMNFGSVVQNVPALTEIQRYPHNPPTPQGPVPVAELDALASAEALR